MPTENPLPRLRQVTDEISRIDELFAERDRLIRRAATLEHSQREIAIAAKISQTRVNQIVNSPLIGD